MIRTDKIYKYSAGILSGGRIFPASNLQYPVTNATESPSSRLAIARRFSVHNKAEPRARAQSPALHVHFIVEQEGAGQVLPLLPLRGDENSLLRLLNAVLTGVAQIYPL